MGRKIRTIRAGMCIRPAVEKSCVSSDRIGCDYRTRTKSLVFSQLAFSS